MKYEEKMDSFHALPYVKMKNNEEAKSKSIKKQCRN